MSRLIRYVLAVACAVGWAAALPAQDQRTVLTAMAFDAFRAQQDGDFRGAGMVVRSGAWKEVRWLADAAGYLKVEFTDEAQFAAMKAVLTVTRPPLVIQAYHVGQRFEADQRPVGWHLLAYCYNPTADDPFIAQNRATRDCLRKHQASRLSELLSRTAVVPVIPDDPDAAAEAEAGLFGGFALTEPPMAKKPFVIKDNTTNDADRKALAIFMKKWQAEIDGRKDKCLCAHTPTDDEKACADWWRPLIRKICPTDFQTAGKDDPDIVVGHIPDVVAGGHPSPGGCYCPLPRAVNSSVGSQSKNNKDADKAGQVKYNEVRLEKGTSTKDPYEPTAAEIKAETDKLTARKKKFDDYMKDLKNAADKKKYDDCLKKFPLPEKAASSEE